MKKYFVLLTLIFISIVGFSWQMVNLQLGNYKVNYPATMMYKQINASPVFCVRAVDGDTLKVSGVIYGEKMYVSIRIIGADTPETVDPRKPVQYYGPEASKFAKSLFTATTVYLTFDKSKYGKYHRVLAYVWLKYKDYYVMYNALIIANGYARYYPWFPFKKSYMEIFDSLQSYARKNKKGLWSTRENNIPTSSTASITITNIHYSGKDEYVTIENNSSSTIDMYNWKLTSNPPDKQKYIFPHLIVSPHSSIEIHSGPSAKGKYIWTKRYIWNNKGDEAILYNNLGKVVSKYKYPLK